MASALRLVLADQLSISLASLRDCDKKNDLILMAEVKSEASYVKHHKKKIAFLFSAMRHFAAKLENEGFNVRYIKYDDKDNQGSLFKEVKRAVEISRVDKIELTFPGEFRVLEDFKSWRQKFNIPVNILDDDRFLSSIDDFADWAQGKKQLRMEYFYRQIRRSTFTLMEGQEPTGGKWNYDSANRRAMDNELSIPVHTQFEPDAITQEVLDLVAHQFADHFGNLEHFHFACTREQALQVLKSFVAQRLENFGQYQDAMVQGKPWLFHSHISFYLNCGLLLPKEVIEEAENAYRNGNAPLNSVEGFIRQILGWREYVRGIYWLKMPDYKVENALNAKRRLPEFFWTADTNMNCLQQCITETRDNAYAHHIQRLMVLGNFLLLSGVHPDEVNEWYLIVYADAYEWVEMPNVSGMILYADGGLLASKPYAASGSYINKMSNYCQHCHYNVKEKNGAQACPFNYLYWDFLERNKEALQKNPRLGMPYSTLNKMSDDKVRRIRQDSDIFFTALDNNQKV
ncbi:cryptochrome/photolyase family protein [Aliiglaciecola lipolytica]|uniref:Deoxyribodipyrimidine photolyase-related protein n=1 Tax=Aliiglaciecola lipolytica E3 TaxID=1127673 RepID=K6Y7Z0_9ALTE|nr:cryptochrome/photolyase family protein [Aliiglaciecola lipolytica]GAC12778.1 deoxyribodipyrimidine photolyase-related protein [Aliiglaciecola lipolytica E3]